MTTAINKKTLLDGLWKISSLMNGLPAGPKVELDREKPIPRDSYDATVRYLNSRIEHLAVPENGLEVYWQKQVERLDTYLTQYGDGNIYFEKGVPGNGKILMKFHGHNLVSSIEISENGKLLDVTAKKPSFVVQISPDIASLIIAAVAGPAELKRRSPVAVSQRFFNSARLYMSCLLYKSDDDLCEGPQNALRQTIGDHVTVKLDERTAERLGLQQTRLNTMQAEGQNIWAPIYALIGLAKNRSSASRADPLLDELIRRVEKNPLTGQISNPSELLYYNLSQKMFLDQDTLKGMETRFENACTHAANWVKSSEEAVKKLKRSDAWKAVILEHGEVESRTVEKKCEPGMMGTVFQEENTYRLGKEVAYKVTIKKEDCRNAFVKGSRKTPAELHRRQGIDVIDMERIKSDPKTVQ